VYLDYGDGDRNVPFSQNVTLANLLAARGVDVTLNAVRDELHEYTVYAHEPSGSREPPTFWQQSSQRIKVIITLLDFGTTA
jgi:hypothetical protein